MARKTRIEVEGGLYHLITRGNGRRDIFHSPEDHDKFLQVLMAQKGHLPFHFIGILPDDRSHPPVYGAADRRHRADNALQAHRIELKICPFTSGTC